MRKKMRRDINTRQKPNNCEESESKQKRKREIKWH